MTRTFGSDGCLQFLHYNNGFMGVNLCQILTSCILSICAVHCMPVICFLKYCIEILLDWPKLKRPTIPKLPACGAAGILLHYKWECEIMQPF